MLEVIVLPLFSAFTFVYSSENSYITMHGSSLFLECILLMSLMKFFILSYYFIILRN